MARSVLHKKHKYRRPATVVVPVVVVMFVLVGVTALTVDVGAMYNAKSDLQRTADAAALAAALRLGDYGSLEEGDSIEGLAVAAAMQIAQRNQVLGQTVTIDPATDVSFGRATFNTDTQQYEFTPDVPLPDAVRIRVRKTADSSNQALSLYFARLFGINETEMAAEAIAIMVPRDIAIVADLSASHNDDSELRHYEDTDINLFDVWANLPSDYDISEQTDGLGFTSSISVTDNGDGTSTISVDYTSDGSEDTPALSHLTFGMPEGALEMAGATATSEGGYPVEVGIDPTTGLVGVKFDETELGEDGVVETQTFSFQIPNDQLAYLEVASKAGGSWDMSEYNLSVGPTWGFMEKLGYGTTDLDETYDPTADPGLIKLEYNRGWTDAQLEDYLYEQGYIESEVEAMLSADYDTDGAYKYRVAVALGLAVWNSGHEPDPGTGELALWEKRGVDPDDTGNANGWVGSSELEWTETMLGRSAYTSKSYWLDYINGYVNKTWTKMYQANPDFRYRFGVKTLTNYLMERKPTNSETPELADVPTQPMQAVKDAVNYMVTFVDGLDTDDQISLEIYGTTAQHEVDLTHRTAEPAGLFTSANRLNEMQAGHYDIWTNVGGGLERAIEELSSARARGISRKMIILLTDGIANVNEDGATGDEAGGAAYAVAQAEAAAALGIRIFAVSVGVDANQALMDQIADIGQGEHFHAEGSIEEYSAELAEIFQQLGGMRPVELIQ